MAWNFTLVRSNIDRTKRDLPVQLANQAQRYFVGSWKNQGWDGQQWKEVKRRIPDTKEYKYPKTKDLGRHTRAILVKSGTMRRAVNDSIRLTTFDKIKLVVGDREAPYARYHNNGEGKLPQRQFMGQTSELTTMQKKKIDDYFIKVWGL